MTHLIQLHSFDGGIHPAENKQQSTRKPVQIAPLPAELVLPLGQHIGAPADPCVSVGERVLKGQKIAEPHGFVSVALHAPTSGEIIAIEKRAIPHASGLQDLCMVIRPDGEERWIEHQSLLTELTVDDLTDIEPAKVVERIRDCGIAGMGGAGFPTSVKLTVKRDEQGSTPIDTLILNGAECEPYITADDMLMRERADEVLRGAQVLLYLLNAERCMIGIEDNKPEAIAALNEAAKSLNEEHHIDVVTIPTKYPSGGEKQLIQILTGKEVPSGGIPAQLGIVCQNVGTAAAIYRAVYHGEPLISRIATITGDATREPGNWEVLLGTPVSHLLQLAGYQPQQQPRVIMGGPMMGFALPHTELPVVKTTNCLLAPSEQEMPVNQMAMACIRCGMCTEACPAQLLPQQLYWFSRAEEYDKAEQHHLFDCIECGACSYVCPSQIPLVQYYRHAKGAIREEKAAQAKSERAKERFERRQARHERELEEKEAKRKARAEAAAQSAAAKKAAGSDDAAPAAGNASAVSADAPTTSPQLEKLQKQLTATQTAIAKTKEKLAEAQQAVAAGDEAMQTKVDAFTAALEKSQTKMKDIARDMAAEKKALKAQAAAPAGNAEGGPDKGDPNSPDRLKRKWETAQARLDTALKRLAEAKAEGLDTVETLQSGIDKQQARVDEAKAAYEAALQAEQDGSSAPDAAATEQAPAAADSAAEADSLKKKVLAQQDRLAKATERLNMAQQQGLDTVEALAKGVDKQQQKLDELQQQLASLTETAAASTAKTTEDGTV
ncbi:electron transport complex subunit RsxC [Oceanobacter mangrovi]|uniref:electron transport complex subunit RsxC n=1 Tax=Oceanobacter mangrovi TaxID=2862510 RepID=UPI001C8D71AA|nr:electron transport complex subunit RsxC [Oceanobacter mangrovi]